MSNLQYIPENKSQRLPIHRSSSGFIQIIVVIIIALVLLRLAGINILEWLNTPAVKDFSLYVRDMLKAVWSDLTSIISFFFKL